MEPQAKRVSERKNNCVSTRSNLSEKVKKTKTNKKGLRGTKKATAKRAESGKSGAMDSETMLCASCEQDKKYIEDIGPKPFVMHKSCGMPLPLCYDCFIGESPPPKCPGCGDLIQKKTAGTYARYDFALAAQRFVELDAERDTHRCIECSQYVPVFVLHTDKNCHGGQTGLCWRCVTVRSAACPICSSPFRGLLGIYCFDAAEPMQRGARKRRASRYLSDVKEAKGNKKARGQTVEKGGKKAANKKAERSDESKKAEGQTEGEEEESSSDVEIIRVSKTNAAIIDHADKVQSWGIDALLSFVQQQPVRLWSAISSYLNTAGQAKERRAKKGSIKRQLP